MMGPDRGWIVVADPVFILTDESDKLEALDVPELMPPPGQHVVLGQAVPLGLRLGLDPPTHSLLSSDSG